MHLEQYCRFLGCESEQNCGSEALQSLAETFARKLVQKDLDMTVSQDAFSAGKTVVDAMEKSAVKKRGNVWVVPKQLAIVQKFLMHLLQFMSIYLKANGILKTPLVLLCDS